MNDESESRVAVLSELLNKRYSCRGYRPDPVPRADIERIMEMAQRTASWCNSQAWHVWVAGTVATERLRSEMVEYARNHQPKPDFAWPEYQGVYQQRRRECGLQLYQATGVARGDHAAGDRQRLENFRFFGAPHVAIVTTDEKLGIYGAIDCGAYVSNFALAARAMGVATIAQAALAAYPQFWRDRLGLAPCRKLVCGISFGYEDSDHPANSFRTSRAPVTQAMTWIE